MEKCFTLLNRKFFYPCLFLAASLPPAFAQVAPAKIWDKTIGGNDNENLTGLQQTTDGGYILCGWSGSGQNGEKSEPSRSPGLSDYWIVKLDQNGNKSWDKTYGGNDTDMAQAIQQTADGGYIVCGYSQSGQNGDKSQANIGNADFWILKLDAAGNKVWDKTFGGNENDMPYAIQQTSDGGYIVGGQSYSDQTGDKSQSDKGVADFWIVRLNASGLKLWDKTFGGNELDFITCLKQTTDGGFILGGNSRSGHNGDKSQPNKSPAGSLHHDFWVIKTDANGNKLWDKTLGGDLEDRLQDLDQASDGSFILAGGSISGINGDKTQLNRGKYDYWILKLSSAGAKIWDKTYGGNEDDVAMAMKLTSDGGMIIAGTSESSLNGDKTQLSRGAADYWLLKLSATGVKTWEKALGGAGVDRLHGIWQTSDGGYVAGGYSDSGLSGEKSQLSRGSNDFWIARLAGSVTGINGNTAEAGFAIYPNPSQGSINIILPGSTAAKLKLTVADILGRTVNQQELTVINGNVSEALELPAEKGIYLLRLETGNQTFTKKIVRE